MNTSARLRRLIAVTLAALSIVGLTFGVADTASAAPPTPVVLVSSDGVHFARALATGLFADAGQLVPGDSSTTRFWIKNPTKSRASVEVTIGHLATPSTDFAEHVTLGSWNSISKGTVLRRWDALSQCGVLVAPRTLPAGGTIEVDLTISMLDASGTVAQHQTGSLNAIIDMQDAAGGAIVAPKCATPLRSAPDDGPGSFVGTALAFTGKDFPRQLLIGGAALLGAGCFVLLVLFRRRKEES